MRKLAKNVLEYIRRQGFLRAGDRAGVAVSGGADSVALLRLLLELRDEIGVVLSVVHFNHNLRGVESDADERFVAQLARHHELELHCDRGDVTKHSEILHFSTEAAARDLRYQYFRRLMAEKRLNCVATGHTLDDQAETVLLRLARGAGTRGMAGIYPRLIYSKLPQQQLVQSESGPEFVDPESVDPRFSVHSSLLSVVRPLLSVERVRLEAFLTEIGQDWREDSSNRDLRHARNRVRHGIMPRLVRALNPRVKEALAETAEIARAEEEYWQREVERVLREFWDFPGGRLSRLDGLPLALQRRVVRAAAESLGLRLESRHLEEIFGLAAGSSAMLPAGWTVSRREGFQFEAGGKEEPISDYAYGLAVPGVVQVLETGVWFEAAIVPGGAFAGYNPDHAFDPGLLPKKLTVRNWRPGDRFWLAHSKAPKKVKELLQERKLAGRERKLWPVVVSGQEIVWMRGFPAPMRLRPREGAIQALVFQERTIQEYGNA